MGRSNGVRGWVLPLAALALAFPLLAAGGGEPPAAGDSAETIREQALSLAAEAGAPPEWQSPLAFVPPQGLAPPLFVGVDDTAIPAYRVEPTGGGSVEAFTGGSVWGAAYDEVREVVYFNTGASLYEWPVGGSIRLLGSIVDDQGTQQSIVSLACHEGILFGTKNIANEAVYRIDPESLLAVVHIDYEDVEYDFGGLAADPRTGILYGTNDDADPYGMGLFRINADGSGTLIAPYPDAQTDLDGLAIGTDGRAYLIPDEPGSIYVYDLDADEFATPIANPWTTSRIFSGGTWLWAPAQCLAKGKIACSFTKVQSDAISLAGELSPDDLPVLSEGLKGDFRIGDYERPFTLTSKGKSLKDDVMKVSINPTKRTFSVSFKKVNLAAPLDLADEDVAKPGEPRAWRWTLRLDNGWRLGGRATFQWTATKGKGGKGPLVP